MNMMSSGCYMIDDDYNVINVNETAQKIYPQLIVGKKCYKCLMNLDEPCGPCPVANGIKGPRTYVDPIRHISEMVDAVDFYDEEKGQCHALVFSTVEHEATFAATLPTSAEELKNLSLIKALTVDYYDVFSVDIQTDDMTLYRHNGKALDENSIYKKITSYKNGVHDHIKKYVYEEDKEMMFEKCDIEYIVQTLKNTESFMLHYRVLLDDEIHYFFRKIVRIGNSDSFENIVVGVGCEDETVKSEQLNIMLQSNLEKVQHDLLTGLLTKAAFYIQGGKLLEENTDTQFDLCILKIENLELINYQYGNLTRDKILSLVGYLLQKHIDDTSVISYIGGSTFASLTKTTSTEHRQNAIHAFKNEIIENSEVKNLNLKWSINKEIRRDLSLEDIYEKTVYALSNARVNRNQEYVEFNQSIMDQLDFDEAIEKGFKQALENREFVAYYQPKYSVETKEIVGAEALVRWIKPNGEMVPPFKFIPVLERCGMINLLDQEIFRQTCELQRFFIDNNMKQIPISVNLSRASIFKNDIANTYASIAKEYGVETKYMPIEITESSAVRATSIRDFANSLLEKGFSLHMDDFGSGYSSLVSLQILPFESIKLDKSLIDYIGQKKSESILKHTIGFAKESGMKLVAEGVETLEQFMFLKIAGCDEIQGYYFSKPLDKKTFLSELGKEVL